MELFAFGEDYVTEVCGKLLGDDFRGKVASFLQINREALSLEFSQQPALQAHFGALAAKAAAMEDAAKLDYEIEMAHLDGRVRRELEERGEKVTEKAVEAVIRALPVYRRINDALIAAKERAGVFRSIAYAFSDRGKLLSSMGAMYRAEMESDLGTIRAKAAEVRRTGVRTPLRPKIRPRPRNME